MRIKTQRKTFHAIGGGMLLLSVGFFVWTVAEPNNQSIPQASTKVYDAKKTIEGPTMSQLGPLLEKKLQAPLDPPKETKKTVVSSPNQIAWPSVTLDCIFFGRESKLAVFTASGQTYTCSEGDKVLGISIDEIRADSIKVTFQGEHRLFRAESKSEKSPIQ